MTYVKLFGSILDSTVWNEPGSTRLVWITMLAMADQHGCIWASVPGLAKRAGVERAECERALECFMAPDPDSRTKDFEGRRIEAIDGGWALLNHAKFRELLSAEDQKTKATERQRRHRERKAPVTLSVTPCHALSQEVTPVTTSDEIKSDQNRLEETKTLASQEGVAPRTPAPQGSFKLAAHEQPMSNKPTAPDMAEAVTHFMRRWVEVRKPDDGAPPTLTKADRGQLVAMLKTHGLDGWKRHLERYLVDDTDRIVKKTGWPLRLMPSLLDGYRTEKSAPSHVGHARPAPHNTERVEHEL